MAVAAGDWLVGGYCGVKHGIGVASAATAYRNGEGDGRHSAPRRGAGSDRRDVTCRTTHKDKAMSNRTSAVGVGAARVK